MISLERNEYTAQAVNGQYVWPLIVTATADSDSPLPDEIFVYHIMPLGMDIDEEFDKVANYTDLSTISTDPDTDEANPYYRKASLRLDFENLADAENGWDRIQQDVQSLVNDAKVDEADTGTVTVVIS
jgi:hypothetical protein